MNECLSDIYIFQLENFCSSYIQGTAVLDCRLMQLVLLHDGGLVRAEIYTCGNRWTI